MAIKQFLEEAMAKIVAERDREVAIIRQKTNQEKIVPHNTEIDTASNNAIAKLQKEFTEKSSAEQQAYNARVAQLQQEFSQKKQEIVEAGVAEKEEFARVTISADTATVLVKYDSQIAKIREQIQSLEE